MADPPVEAVRPPQKPGEAPINLSMCFNKPPDVEEVFGTIEGVNSRRLLQAEQDESLRIFHHPPPENPRRPQSLYDVLPQSQRKLLSHATYIWDSKKENRTQVWIVVTDSRALFLRANMKRTGEFPPPHNRRALFKIGNPDIDVRTLQFLQNAICTICERLPSHSLVPIHDKSGTNDSLDEVTAYRNDYLRPYTDLELQEHAAMFKRCLEQVRAHMSDGTPEPKVADERGQTLFADLKRIVQKHQKPTAQPAPFSLGKLDERLKDFITRAARRHAGMTLNPPQIKLSPGRPPSIETKVQVMYRSSTDQTTEVRMQVIQLELQRIPPHEDMQKHAFGLLAWISAHTMDRVFEPGSLESYVDYLKGLACLGSRFHREVPGHGGLYGGMDLFTIGVADAGYTISPSAAAVAHISSGHLPKICVVGKRDALLRVIERLETVYLATGKIESAWKECARRSDFETVCVQEDEPLSPTRCTCTFAERPSTVHLCNRCNRSLLCGNNVPERGPHVEIVCSSCADEERRERPKCHTCHVRELICDFTEGSDRCDQCAKYRSHCRPIQLTDSGDLPETDNKARLARKAESEDAARKAAQAQDGVPVEDDAQVQDDVPVEDDAQVQDEAQIQDDAQIQGPTQPQPQSLQKCHKCHCLGHRCKFTNGPGSAKCESCTLRKFRCFPLRLTESGELPLTVSQRTAQRKKQIREEQKKLQPPAAPKCHRCHMQASVCNRPDGADRCDLCAKDKKSCVPIKLTDTGDYPKTYNQRKALRAEGLTSEDRLHEVQPMRHNAHYRLRQRYLESLRDDVNMALEGQDKGARGLLNSVHYPGYWHQIEEQWSSGSGWPDEFQRINRAFDPHGRPLLHGQVDDVVDPDASGNAGNTFYGPFGMELDALNPVYPFHGGIVNHAPDNVVPTSKFLNSLRHYYAPLLLPMVALLCRDPDRKEMDRISQTLDHIFLIALQFPRDNKQRVKLFHDVQRTSAINRQHINGIAEPEACLLIDRPWQIAGNHGHRYHNTKRRPSTVVMDIARVEAFIAELETKFDQKLPRAPGDAGAVYLFHPTNRPVDWDWYYVRSFYSWRLAIMTDQCNKHYDTDCTVESLFALHCIQYMQAQGDTAMSWVLLLLQPYTRHPFQASAGHIAHGLQMTTGFDGENISLAAFRERECNITFEPFVCNFMKSLFDNLVPRMEQKLRALPLHNPPYWTEELVRAHAPDVPATQWGGMKKSEPKKGKSKKGESTSGEPTTNVKKPRKSKKSQLGAGSSRVLRERKSSAQRKLSTSAVGNPNRVNLTNQDNICYASAVVQVISNVPALRALVSNIDELPFSHETGRGLGGFLDLKDPGFVKYKEVATRLSTACSILESTNERVGAHIVLDLMGALRKIDPQFVLDEEYDASFLFNSIITLLNAAGDRSKVLSDMDSARPHTKLRDDQEQRIRDGQLLRPLPEELADQRAAHHAFGNDSDADRATNIECVEESMCTFTGCVSPHSRSFHNLRTLRVTFPVDQPGYSPDRAYDINELIQLWAVKEGRSTCDHGEAHGQREEAVKKIVGTPEVLVIHVDRLARAEEERRRGQDLDDVAGFMKNPLVVHQTIDLREQCERELPTEAMLDTRLKTPLTTYRLRAVLRYTHRHFLTYALTPDEKKTLHWAKFDDLRGRVEWEDPTRPISEQSGNTFDFMLFYERMNADEEAASTAQRDGAAASGDITSKVVDISSGEGDADEEAALIADGEGATALGDTATKAIDISSGEEDSDEEGSEMDLSGAEEEASEYAGSSDKANSDDVEAPDDAEDFDENESHDTEESPEEFYKMMYEEFDAELHEMFGNEVEYEGLPDALVAESASDFESSDDGSVMSLGDEGSDDGIAEPDHEDFTSEGEDFDADPAYEDLTPEAQAREISIVFQQAAEPAIIPDNIKSVLMINSKQVLIAGSKLAKALQKQAQGDDYEPSGESAKASDDEMFYQTVHHDLSPEGLIRQVREPTPYEMGYVLAVGADSASDRLEADENFRDLLRKLHLYTGRAIEMCKKLHEVDGGASEDENSALFAAVPNLRSYGLGLRLAACYRSIANALYALPEEQVPHNYPDLCNLHLCSSYVTEMGWKLDDLEVAQADHDSKVAELEARNQTLETQVAELQAQLQDLKVAKPQDPNVTKPAVKPDASTMSAADFYEHMQSMQSAMQTLVQESRKFILPDQGAPVLGSSDEAKIDEMEVDLPVTSHIPGHGPDALQDKQDANMSEGLPSRPAISDLSGSGQIPPDKQDVTTPEGQPSPTVTSGITGSGQDAPKEKQDTPMSGVSPKEGGVTQPKLDPGKPKLGQKTTTSRKEPGPASKPPGSPSKGLPKPPKGGIPNFMSTTAAAAAKSRPPASKTDTTTGMAPPARAPTRGETRTGHRPKTRAATHAATRAGVSADDQTPARPETPVRQPATSLAAPATRESVHTGGRRRQGHVGDLSPPSPSQTPNKKRRGDSSDGSERKGEKE